MQKKIWGLFCEDQIVTGNYLGNYVGMIDTNLEVLFKP